MMHARKFIWKVVFHIVIAILLVYILFPFFWIVSSSLKSPTEIFNLPPSFIPKLLTIDNYLRVIRENDLAKFILNSISVTLFTIAPTLITAFFASVAFGIYSFRFKKVLYGSLMIIQMMPMIMLLVPMFLIFSKIGGGTNNHVALVAVYINQSVPIAVILLTGYVNGVPYELVESARIDGCSTVSVLFRILLPLLTPGLFAVGIYIFIRIWQEFLFAVSFLSLKDSFTLPVGITTFIQENSIDWGGLMTVASVITLPAIFLISTQRKYFIDSFAGAVKG